MLVSAYVKKKTPCLK